MAGFLQPPGDRNLVVRDLRSREANRLGHRYAGAFRTWKLPAGHGRRDQRVGEPDEALKSLFRGNSEIPKCSFRFCGGIRHVQVMREVECMLGDGDQSSSWSGPLRLDESLKG